MKLSTTEHWHELANRHAGRPAVVVGKGPSLDQWLQHGCPMPSGALLVGINHAGGAVACDYNVSVHDFPEFGQIPGTWATGMPQPPRSDFSVVHWRRPAFPAHWFLQTFRPEVLDWAREEIAEWRWLYVQDSSAQPAIHLAWYLGCSSLLMVGIDGGNRHAAAMQGQPGLLPPHHDYSAFLAHTFHAADRLFPRSWSRWGPPSPRPMP